MIHTVKLDLKNGYYEIVRGKDFNVESDSANHLVYKEDGVWYVVSDPDSGKAGNTFITIPQDVEIKNFFLHGKNTAIKCDNIKSHTIYIDIKDGVGEFLDIKCDRMAIAMGKGEIRTKITELESLKVDCGYGSVNVDLPYMKDGYDITSNCGMGEVTLNSEKLPRQYTVINSGKTIEIICGLGCVNINTYSR